MRRCDVLQINRLKIRSNKLCCCFVSNNKRKETSDEERKDQGRVDPRARIHCTWLILAPGKNFKQITPKFLYYYFLLLSMEKSTVPIVESRRDRHIFRFYFILSGLFWHSGHQSSPSRLLATNQHFLISVTKMFAPRRTTTSPQCQWQQSLNHTVAFDGRHPWRADEVPLSTGWRSQ